MDLNWDDLRYFLAIARSRSLTGAAKDLGVSQPTVSRRLSAIEQRFGVKLFERTISGYELSIAGNEVFDAVRHIAQELEQVELKIFGQDRQISGPIRVTCTEVMANLYLAEHLGRFIAEHPNIKLNVICTFANLSLSRHEADVALRVSRRPPETLIGRRLARVAIGVYGSVRDCTPTEPGAWTWIGWRDEAYTRLLISTPFPEAQIKHHVDDMQTMRAMVRAGLGVAALPCYMADVDPGLRRVLPAPIVQDALDLWVLYHPDVKSVARIRLFADYVADTIIADRDLFEGKRPLAQPVRVG